VDPIAIKFGAEMDSYLWEEDRLKYKGLTRDPTRWSSAQITGISRFAVEMSVYKWLLLVLIIIIIIRAIRLLVLWYLCVS